MKIIMTIFFILSLSACGTSGQSAKGNDFFSLRPCEVEEAASFTGDLEIKQALFGIYKRSKITGFLPQGFLLYEIIVMEKGGKPLGDPSRIKSVDIVGPDKKLLYTVDKKEFNPGAGTLRQSGFKFFKGHTVFTGYDIALNGNVQPASGVYTFVVRGSKGETLKKEILFQQSKDPMDGYPENIFYDQKSKTLSWKGIQGQNGYRFAFVKGDYPGYFDTAKIAYFAAPGWDEDSKISGLTYRMPKEFILEKGQKYHIIMVAHNSTDNTFESQSFFRMQDHPDHVPHFVAE